MNPDDISWITENIAITNFFSAHNKEALAEHQVQALLCLDREVRGDAAEARGVKCIELVHLVDGPNDLALFRNAVTTLEELLGRWEKVVVHCRAGRSRRIAVVAAYLKKAKGWEADEALDFVRAKREAAVAPELIALVERFGE